MTIEPWKGPPDETAALAGRKPGRKKPQSSLALDLKNETEAAETLIAHLKAAEAEALDQKLLLDMVEGETGLIEVLGRAVKMVREGEADLEAKKEYLKEIGGDIEYLEKRVELIRAAIENALRTSEQDKIPTPFGTPRLQATPPKLDIVDEMKIPARFWRKPDPVISKKDVRAALEAGEKVDGAVLLPAGKTLYINKR